MDAIRRHKRLMERRYYRRAACVLLGGGSFGAALAVASTPVTIALGAAVFGWMLVEKIIEMADPTGDGL